MMIQSQNASDFQIFLFWSYSFQVLYDNLQMGNSKLRFLYKGAKFALRIKFIGKITVDTSTLEVAQFGQKTIDKLK